MEEKEFLIGISTYLKTPALEELLSSLFAYRYDLKAEILVTDDDPNHSALDTCRKFEGVSYIGGGIRGGIAVQKNRSIKYFLENSNFKYLLLLDDDIIFYSGGLLETLVLTRLPHVTGYLGQWESGVGVSGYDERPQLSKNPFFVDFPIEGQTEDGEVVYCFGSQGGMLFFTREILEKAQYFHIPPGEYGYEHSIFSNVINKIQGLYINWFPILWNSPKYFRDNGKFPNQYDASIEITKNNSWWAQKKVDIDKGINYINKVHGVPETEEVIRS